MTLPLTGTKVLDFTHLLPGELCSALLCDLGAEVIRVERLEPGLVKHLPPIVKGESLYYWSLHRDEKRIAVNLKAEQGVAIVAELVKDADILLENFRPGVMGRLGLGYGKMHALNPRLLYTSISSYGQHSVHNLRPCHDLNIQAETGLLHVGRDAGGKPVMPGILASDFMSGLFAALSTVSALYERNATGKGRHIDISMFNSTMYLQCLAATASRYLDAEPLEADPMYRAEQSNYNVFKCKDGRYVAVGSLELPFWKTMCEHIGRPDLGQVLGFGANPKLKGELAAAFAAKTQQEWMETFTSADCCVSPVNTVAEAMQFLPESERKMLSSIIHPVLGEVQQLRAPFPFEQHHKTATVETDVSSLTESVLKELGYTVGEIERLQADGVIPPSVRARA